MIIWVTAIMRSTLVANNSPQEFSHPDDHFQSRHATPRFKPLIFLISNLSYDPYSPVCAFIAKLLRKSSYEGCA